MGTELLTKLAIINDISKIIVYDNLSRGHRSLFFWKIINFFIQNSFCSWRNIGLPIIKKTIEWYINNEKWWRNIQNNNYRQQRLGLNTK